MRNAIWKANIPRRRAVLTAAEFRDVHRLQCLHSGAYFAIAALLVENETEPIRPMTVFFREDKGVEGRLHRVLLRTKSQTAWQTKLLSM